MSGALSNALHVTRAAERERAARAILRRPLLLADGKDAETYVEVRRHAQYLREWLRLNTGWSLLVNAELARLVKSTETRHPQGADAHAGDHTHPAVDARSHQPFSRRRYVLFCLSLAALSRADSQVTLGRLAEQVVLSCADPALAAAGITFTLERRDERSDLVAVVRQLMDYGVLARVAGEEDAFLEDIGDVLYDVRRRVLSTLLSTARGPSTVDEAGFEERLARLTEAAPAPTEEIRSRQIRHRLTRLLLDGPVVYYDELDEEERAYLLGQRTLITGKITEFTGLIAEARAEGVAMVDPQDALTDIRMPETGTDGHATLLIADYLSAGSRESVPLSELLVWLTGQAEIFVAQHVWRRAAIDPGGPAELLDIALARLEALRLVRRERGGPSDSPSGGASGGPDSGPSGNSSRGAAADSVRLLPAIARYGLGAMTVTGDPPTLPTGHGADAATAAPTHTSEHEGDIA